MKIKGITSTRMSLHLSCLHSWNSSQDLHHRSWSHRIKTGEKIKTKLYRRPTAQSKTLELDFCYIIMTNIAKINKNFWLLLAVNGWWQARYAKIPALTHHTPDVGDAQLLLEIFGEKRASAAVSTDAVGHDEHQWTSAALHKLPAQHTAFTNTCTSQPCPPRF